MQHSPRVAVLLLLALICIPAVSELGHAEPPQGGVEGIHGRIPEFPANSCWVCHDIVDGATGPDAVKKPNDVCLGCHTDGATYGEGDPYIQDRPHATPVGNHTSVVTGSAHFLYGDFGVGWPWAENEQQIHCTTCHDPHRTFDPDDPDPSTNNLMYVRDHTDDFQVTPSGQLILQPTKELKVIDNTAPGGQSHYDGEDCTACHTHPGGFGVTLVEHPQALTDCSNCHLNPGGKADLVDLHDDNCSLCHIEGFPDTFPAGRSATPAIRRRPICSTGPDGSAVTRPSHRTGRSAFFRAPGSSSRRVQTHSIQPRR